MTKWTDIESLHNVRRNMLKYKALVDGVYDLPTVEYRAKVKLHGMNAGVRVEPDGTVTAQGRNNDLTPENDNHGFAQWVATKAFRDCAQATTLVIHGEWCGRGINSGCAIQQIDCKLFAVFAAEVRNMLFTEPEDIAGFMGPTTIDIHILPWYNGIVSIPFGDDDGAQRAAGRINGMVADVEACDPWMKAIFAIDGIGEGLVFYPILGTLDRDTI